MSTTILIDADIVAYKVAVLNQQDYDFGDTGSARVLDHDNAIRQTEELLHEYAETLTADRIVVCLSEPDPEKNFRRQLNPTYKANRKSVELPEMLMWVKEYLAHEYPSFRRPRLEADDCMGILATRPALLGPRYADDQIIIVSEDKDMRTIPAKVYNPGKPEVGVLDISELDADRFLMWQTVVGDPTDGYPGCPGVGKGGRFVEYAPDILVADREELWDLVLMAYASKGFTEDDAILQARMAHILRAGSYNFKAKKVRLWQPYWLL